MIEDKPIVFVTQIPQRRDSSTKVFVPTININPAREHGDLRVMLPSDASSFYATGDLVRELSKQLLDYDYERGDAVVFTGDPSIMAVTAAYLGKTFGRFIILKWDRNLGRYLRSHVQV